MGVPGGQHMSTYQFFLNWPNYGAHTLQFSKWQPSVILNLNFVMADINGRGPSTY